MGSITYNTRLVGLSVTIDKAQMAGEKDKVVFTWSTETGLPLTTAHKDKIQANCSYYLAGDFTFKLYPESEEEKEGSVSLPSTKGKYVTVVKALSSKF